MDKELTEIAIVLDESGSMAKIQGEVLEGLNSFLKTQRAMPGKANLTLVTFSSYATTRLSGTDIRDVKDILPYDYCPGGMTALHDAVAATIDSVGERLGRTPECQRPGKVIFVIVTDGLENHSRKFCRADVFSRIKHQRTVYSWEFLFLAANQDAFESGNMLGIAHSLNFTASSSGARGMGMALGDYTSSVRRGESSAASYASAALSQASLDPDAAKQNAQAIAAGGN